MKKSPFILLVIFPLFFIDCNKPSTENLSQDQGLADPDRNRTEKKEEHTPGPPPFARVKSPEFNTNGTITFRIWAPKATQVKLQCAEIVGGQSDIMERYDDEYWQITVKPEKSGLFRYRFMVDEVQTADPVNSLSHGSSSLLLVPGEETVFFTVKNTTHGIVHRHFYHNPDIDAVRSVSVYTPPEYSEDQNQKFPVLFLFHGSGGTDESWFSEGKANIILDNLISNGDAKPMIAVAPFGHTVEPGTHGWPFVQEQGDFIQDFMEVLIPYLKKHYRISDAPEDWALAGFSMGGYHTLKIGLNNLDQFGNLGLFSWGGGKNFFEENARHVLHQPDQVDKHIKVFYMACGREDFLYQRQMKMDSSFTELGIDHTFFVSDGGHDMVNWRKYLYNYAQLLFHD